MAYVFAKKTGWHLMASNPWTALEAFPLYILPAKLARKIS
jgi:hypothetical protein